MLPKISVQLYSLREQMKDGNHLAILQKLADAGFAGVELAGFYGMTPKDLRKAINGMGMEISSSHTFPCPTPATVSQTIDQYGDLGIKDLITGFGPPNFESLDTIKAASDMLSAVVAPLARAGITLAIHNHDWEFRRIKGKFVYDYLIDPIPSLMLEIDTYWAANFGAECPASIVRAYRNRASFLHIKDGPACLPREQNMVAVGSGALNVPSIIRAADPNVLRWTVIELDRCSTDMLTAVLESYRYLSSTNLACGRK